MPITARENLLRTLRSGEPEWIPVCLHLFPNENPTQGVPEPLKNVLDSSSGNLAGDILALGAHLGANDYMLPVDSPAILVSDTCAMRHEPDGPGRTLSFLATPKGELRQVTVHPPGSPSLVTERYVKTVGDADLLLAYFTSLRVEVRPAAQRKIRETRERLGERGVLFCRTNGTPLGMCYRVYSDLVNLIYLLADEPVRMGDLFRCMEDRYQALYAAMLEASPEIDAYLGMDDTSTTLISPALFAEHNVELTNARADLCHAHGKLYLHHSCGLIRNLLPVYRRTRMDGVDAFTPPPFGDVGYEEGRKLLGPGYCLVTGLAGGLARVDESALRERAETCMAEVRRVRHVIVKVGGAALPFPAMARLFELSLARRSY